MMLSTVKGTAMCLILLAYKHHPHFRLIVAANRDEFYDRPTAPVDFWPIDLCNDAPQLLAGKDLKNGGTWMGVSRSGRFAALTNYREPGEQRRDAPSRGALVRDFLLGRESGRSYMTALRSEAERHNGFNLIVDDGEALFWFCNRGGGMRELPPGVYGLSNRHLDTPWPKVEKGKAGFSRVIDSSLLERAALDEAALLDLLADQERPPDDRLPDTGVGLGRERMLSPIFITSDVYGTRSSSVLRVGNDGAVRFTERNFAVPSAEITPEITPSYIDHTRTFQFAIRAK